MKEYVVHRIDYKGNVLPCAIFTNKRKAKSFLWNWVNREKKRIRDIQKIRDYEELKGYIKIYNGYNDNEILCYYD